MTLWLVAQCLNQLRHCIGHIYIYSCHYLFLTMYIYKLDVLIVYSFLLMSPWRWKFIPKTYRRVYVNAGVWVKNEYVKSTLKRHLYTQFFYFFGKFFIIKMIHNPFRTSVHWNHITEIIATTNHNWLGHLCYTLRLLNNSFPHCLLEKLWGLYKPFAVTPWISPGTHIPYSRCYRKCNWKHRWNFQMHQIYTGKQFGSEEFLRNRHHVRELADDMWWGKTGQTLARLETSPRKSLESLAQQIVWPHHH